MPRPNTAETLIGAAVVAIALVFAALAYYRTGAGSLAGYEVNARLAKVDGLGVKRDTNGAQTWLLQRPDQRGQPIRAGPGIRINEHKDLA